jgi:hypothetical protein
VTPGEASPQCHAAADCPAPRACIDATCAP